MRSRLFCIVMIGMVVSMSSCTSKLAENSIEANDARNQTSNVILERFSPDNCSYNQYNSAYQCDEQDKVIKMNKRVGSVKKQIQGYLYENPYLTNQDVFGTMIIRDLFYCRDRNGDILEDDSIETTIYCETRFISVMEQELKGRGIIYVGIHNDLHKYMLK